MGISPDLRVSGVHCTMRAVVLVHHTGVGHTVAGVYNAHVPGVHHVAGVHPVHTLAPHTFHYNYMFGKREAKAEAEAEADPLHHTYYSAKNIPVDKILVRVTRQVGRPRAPYIADQEASADTAYGAAPVGRVKIQTYRGPSKGDYDFAPWGYYNTQPADLALHH